MGRRMEITLEVFEIWDWAFLGVSSLFYSDRGWFQNLKRQFVMMVAIRFPDRDSIGPLDAGAFFYGYIFYWNDWPWQESW